MRRRTVLPIAAALVAAALTVVLGAAAQGRRATTETNKASGPATGPPIVLGMSAAFSGPSRGLGIELYRGSMAYLDEVNAHGGVNGRPVVIKAYDDGYNPAPAIYNTIRLIEQDHALVLFDYVGTPTVTRVLPLLKKYADRSILMFSPFTGAEPQREPPYDSLVFNLRASYRDETYGLVDRFVSIGRKRIAVFYQADAYGRSGWDGVRRALAAHGLSLAGEATYSRGTPYTTHLTPQVDILRRANADAVIAVGSYAACAAFVRDVVDAGWKVPIANLSFVGSENMVNLLVKEGRRTGRDYTSDLVNSEVVPSYEDLTLPAVVQYRDLMKAYHPAPPAVADAKGYELLGDNFAGFEGFLNAKVMVEALRRIQGDIVPKKLAAAFESIHNFDLGIDAPISFGPDQHQALQYVYYVHVENGHLMPALDWTRWTK